MRAAAASRSRASRSETSRSWSEIRRSSGAGHCLVSLADPCAFAQPVCAMAADGTKPAMVEQTSATRGKRIIRAMSDEGLVERSGR